MKKIISFLMVLGVVLGCAMDVQAARTGSGVYDGADLLTDSEESRLAETLMTYCDRYEADIAIVTTRDAGGLTAQEYADAYAESLEMAMEKEGYPGILFLIDMDNREIYIATQGRAIDWYDEGRIDRILDDCYDSIIEGEYEATCSAFLQGVRDYMGLEAGRSARMDIWDVLIRLVIALAAGGIITFAMVHQRGGRKTTSAATYLNAAQSHLDVQQDRFINRTVTRRHIPKPEHHGGGPSGRGGGGGFHVSGGGGAHGGGGRKF